MTEPQVNPEHVINILRIRLQDEIYQRALLEAAYNQQKEQLEQLRRQAADQHTQLSQQLEQTPKHLTTMTDADVKETLGINPLKTT